MNRNQPPIIAKWLLRHSGCSPNNAAVVGDLDERYQQGRSEVWYWQQVLSAITVGFFTAIWGNGLLTLRALAVGWGMSLVSRYVLILIREWLSAVVHLSKYPPTNWMMIITWCEGVLAGILGGWLVAKLHRESARAMVLAYAASFMAVILAIFIIYLPELPNPFTIAFALMISIFSLNTLGILFGGGIFHAPETDSNPERHHAAT